MPKSYRCPEDGQMVTGQSDDEILSKVDMHRRDVHNEEPMGQQERERTRQQIKDEPTMGSMGTMR
jgi:predicted small metal-binding protein